MPIDVDVPQSDGWWLDRAYRAMYGKPSRRPSNGALWETRAARLERLWNYYEGNPCLPNGAENAREAVRQFQRKARANYAATCVEARMDRQRLLGVRTVTDNDVDGDDLGRAISDANGFQAVAQDILLYRSVMGEGYAIVGPPDDDVGDKYPLITAEDPRQAITIQHAARPNLTLAGLKLYRDDEAEEDRAHLFLPGRVMVARRKSAARQTVPGIRFSPRTWEWDDDASGNLDLTDENGRKHVAMVRFGNRLGMGDFEKHTDVLDRMNHMILQRIVVAVMQAFRQRGIIGDLPEEDEDGNTIDYDGLFPADPGALWQLPEGVEMWESAGVDLTPILTSVRDDATEFAANTRTPLYYLFPDAANGSAQGASLMREGLTFACEDGITRATPPFIQLWRMAFMLAGEKARANKELSLIWAPVERFSMAERADAAVKAKASGVPTRSVLSEVWQFSPSVVKRMEEERLTDVLLAPEAPGPDANTLATQSVLANDQQQPQPPNRPQPAPAAQPAPTPRPPRSG